MGYISKTDEKRWFCVETIADVIHVFGQVDLGNVLNTGEPTLLTYLTEDELEIYVDNKLGPDAYKDAVENGGELFTNGNKGVALSVVSSTGLGDGIYPVYAIKEEGRIKELIIKFF